jgi:titin
MDCSILRQYLAELQGAKNSFLMENSRFLGNLPENIVYNGLLYTYNLRENAFINQFGHRIDPSAAPAFITEAKAFEQQNLAILDISSSSSDNSSSKPRPSPVTAASIQNPTAIPKADDPTESITLAWSISSAEEENVDSFEIFRSTDPNGPFVKIDTVSTKGLRAFVDEKLDAGTTYYYQIAAVFGGKEGPLSAVVSATTETVKPPAVGITAPSGLTATSIAQNTVNLRWTDNSTNELGFYLYEALNGSTFTLIEVLGAGITVAGVVGLSQDTNYSYRVQAFATGSSSGFSNTLAIRTLPTIPTAPSNLSLLVGGTSQIQVSWTDNSNNEQFFNVFRSTDGVSYPFGITLPAGSTTYLNTGLSAGTTYFYRVNAANTGGTSGFAGPTSAVTYPTIPTAPSNLRFTDRSSNELMFEWNDNSSNESGFAIESSLAGTTYNPLAIVGANINNYNADGLSAGTTYFFRVAAFNAGGTSSFAGPTSWITMRDLPAAPSFTSILAGSSSQINVNWTNVADENGYDLFRGTTSASLFGITTLGPDVTSFADSGLSAGTTYFYRIRGFNEGGAGSFSGITSARTIVGAPNTPTFTSILAGSSSQININWTNVANETGYNLYRSLNDVSYTGITTLGADVTGFTNGGLSAGTTYFYKIEAFNAGGTSALSGSTSAITLPAGTTPSAPTGFTAISATSNSVTLQWTDTSTNEDGFLIYYRGIT